MIIKDGIIIYGDGVELTERGAVGPNFLDGTTTLDNSTFVDEPQPEPFKGGRFKADRTLTDHGKAELSKEMKAKAAAIRYESEIGHPVIDTSRGSQDMIDKAWGICQMTPHVTIDFKMPDGSWVPLTKDQIDPLATQAFSWVQACFSNEKAINEKIDAMASEEDIAAIDLYAGYPEA